jgi:hypothetical protein
MEQPISLPKLYEELVKNHLTEEGIPHPWLIALHHDGTLTMAMLDIPNEQVFETVSMKFVADLTVKEVIFAIDCYTKPGQGTKYNDVLTVFWWRGEETAEIMGWKFGVINYVPPPDLLVEPIDWDNEFWKGKMRAIVQAAIDKVDKKTRIAMERLGISEEGLAQLFEVMRREHEKHRRKGH